MGQLVNNKVVKLYQNKISQLRKDLGRSISVYGTPTKSNCTNCYYDNQRKESTGVYNGTGASPFSAGARCPVCSGKGKIETANITTVNNVTIQWMGSGGNDNLFFEEKIGVFQPGWVRISVNLKDVLTDKSNVNGSTIFDNCDKVVIDSEDCIVKQVIKKGLRDLFTCRVLLRRKSMEAN